MANPRLEKVIANIEKTKDKISELQARLRTLERQKTDIENGQIISLVRSEWISDAELAALLKTLRGEGTDAAAEKTAASAPSNTRLEGTHNANNAEN